MMKPGDMIEWVYRFSDKPVVPGQQIWSTPMNKWVPIGGKALLISVVDGTIVWLSPKGLFHARVWDDTRHLRPGIDYVYKVIPRVCERVT